MPNSQPFGQFASRLTRGYVVLAVVLIAVVAGASSALAFIGYASSYNLALDSQLVRVQQRVQFYEGQHQTLAHFAPQLVEDEARSRARIVVLNLKHHLIAGTAIRPTTTSELISTLLGLHARHLILRDGIIILDPDFDGFVGLMQRYWTWILPVGLLAVLIAWVAGRAISRRAVRPLVDVTGAMKAIAGGDFTPKLLLESDSGLHELTQAYNEVAQRLNLASHERRRQEAEMRQFIADAGHELRTPLTIFMGYLDALRSGVVQDSASVARVQDTMLDESRKMRTIIEKLILLARMEREGDPARDRIDVGSVAARAVDALRPIAGERIRLHTDAEAAVTGDDTELYEALKNIIENAVRYAPDSAVDVRVARDDGYAVVKIEDHGPGMSPVDVEHAFDRFYRGTMRAEIDGSGLGLAIAKRAVERMAGSISLESTSSNGTRVTMRLPVVSE
ncbi:MAG TPA: HAMP domain-containing sensor histidine kinase [Candidatus Baltobacteraceae bacterium]|nr:HAMP domain-containing sensor histidine kinase [Candidatus Baltobacteraceae bacterium]